ARGTQQQLAATCKFSDETTQDCTSQASWVSSSNKTAVVGNAPTSKGLIFGISAGTATISATVNGISGSTMVTVTSAALTGITITPVNPTVAPVGTVVFTATAQFSDGTTQNVTLATSFTSSNPSVAEFIFNTLFALTPGTTTVTGTFQGFQNSTTVTVVKASL